MQEAMIDAIGTWIQINGESLFEIKTNKYLANSTSSYCCDAASDNVSYLFMENIKIDGLSYVTKDYDEYYSRNLPIDIVNVNKEVKAVECLDNNEQLYFYYNKELHMLTVVPSGFSYGTQLVVRVAKILYK